MTYIGGERSAGGVQAGTIDEVLACPDEVVARSRDLAWRSALHVSALPPTRVPAEVDRLDRVVAALALPIRDPGPLARPLMMAIRIREPGDVGRILDALG